VPADECPRDAMILDIGAASVAHLSEVFEQCRTLIWNGPLGAFETPPFDAATTLAARPRRPLTAAGRLVSVAGGGDTVAALRGRGGGPSFSYVSTAGGAFLEWMEGKVLPGVAPASPAPAAPAEPSVFLRLVPLLTIVFVLPAAGSAPAAAQEGPSFLDLLSPERIVEQFLVIGIGALRTQADFQYGEMDVDLMAGDITMTDLRVWPLPAWDGRAECVVTVDRVRLRTTAFDAPDKLRVRVDLAGTRAPMACLPPEAAGVLAPVRMDMLHVPVLGVELVYDVPSAAMTLAAHATAEGLASVEATAAFDYVWFDGRADMENPDPVVYIDHARLRIDDLGGWPVAAALMPPPFTDPATATMVVPGMIGQAIGQANRAADPGAAGDPSAFSPAQRAFLDSVATAWPAFLADPGALVLETRVEGPGYIDFDAVEADMRQLYEILRPVLATAPVRRPDVLPAALLRRALTDPAGLAPDERLRAGLALARGEGAPSNPVAARALLKDLAEENGAAALAMSDALAAVAPEEAYAWALRAGITDVHGAVGRLDRLEAAIGLPRALALQAEAAPLALDAADGRSLAAMRDAAAAHLLGQGRARSYAIAAAWALVGQAAGDRESGEILSDLADGARRAGPEAQAAWAAAEAAASAVATEFWLDGDLPARFGP
jgi:hypothetical protein